MKRILSLLLVLSMMVSLLPAVSAGEQPTEYTSPGITLCYDISGAIEKFKAEGATLTGANSFGGKGFNAFSYEATGGFFEYAANKSRDRYSWNNDGYNYPANVGGRQVMEVRSMAHAGTSGLQFLSYYKASEGNLNNWWAMKIYVPKSGVYTPKATYHQYKKDGETYLDFYMIKNTGEELSTALNEERLSTESDYYIGSKACENPNAASSQVVVTDEALEISLNLDEGEYYLVCKPRVVKPSSDYNGNYAMLSSFTLDGGNTGEAVPMIAVIECDSVRVFDNGETAQLSVKIHKSDKTQKEAVGVKYTALTPEIATVDENTGLVTGLAPGVASFEATVTENGKEYKAEYALTVSDHRLSGITIKYDISGAIEKFKAEGATLTGANSFGGKGFNAFSYEATNGFFEYAANKSRDRYSWNNDGYNYPANVGGRQVLEVRSMNNAETSGLQFLSYYKASEGNLNNWWAMKIYVPKSGVYTPKATYHQYKKDGETYLDFYMIKNTGEELSAALNEERLSPDSDYYIGGKACENLNAASSQVVVKDEPFETSFPLDKGEYYLVCKPRVVKPSSDYNGNYAMLSSFTLDGGNINEPEPMYAQVSADDEKISAGGGITQVSADVYMSDGTVEKGDSVKLTSLTPEYAYINDIFSVVVGKNIGTAKLSAVVTHKGTTLAETGFEITVVENQMSPGEGEVVVYDISSRIANEATLDGENGLKYTDITYATTGDLFEYAANRTNGKYSWANDGWNYTTYGVDKSIGGGSYTRFRQVSTPGRNGLQIWTRYSSWFALKIKVPYTGMYKPAATYWQFGGRGAGAESYLDYYLIKNDGSDMQTLLAEENLMTSSKYYIGSKRNEDSMLSAGQNVISDEPFKNTVTLDEGEYYLVYKVRNINNTENYGLASNFTLDGKNCVKNLLVDVKTDLNLGDREKINILATRLDGTAVDENDITVTYATSDSNVVTVDKDGYVTAAGDGQATVTVTVNDGMSTLSEKISFKSYDDTGVSEFIFNTEEKIYVTQKVLLDIDAIMNSGNILDVPDENITYTVHPEDILTVSNGMLTAVAEGQGTLTTKISYRGAEGEYVTDITVVPQTGKTEPTIYTYEERQNAINNAKKYDWAAKTVKGYVNAGDRAIELAAAMHPQILGEGLPRGRQIGCTGDDYYNYCRYCHANIEGEYSWKCDFGNRPWKVQCSACKRLFPSNDFEGFLKLGVDKQGYFDVDRARQAHHEMLFHIDGEECTCEKPKSANTPEWYIFYGYGNPKGYLYNELYKEIRDSNEDPWGDEITWNDKNGGANLGTYRDKSGNILWQGGDMWGVDDGWGYLPGRIYADGLTERHGWVALYFYEFWMSIYSVVENLNQAYVYTSDPKYGRAGIILLDRIADVWNSFDMYYFKDMFLNTHGGSGYGAATGRINDYELGRRFCPAADAFYPMIYDEQVIRQLSKDAERMGLQNPKTSSELIWRNIADGILITSANMCMDGRINGNYGQAQSVAAYAAVALNEQPKTNEIIEWIYATNTGDNNRNIKGGNFEAKIINDVDRDGMGNEASPRYNTTWIGTLNLFADQLVKYKGDKNYNPYENPKFAKMFSPQMEILITGTKHPNVGDAGSPASVTINGSAGVWYNAFKRINNETYRKEIAQYIYEMTDGNISNLGHDVFAVDPESAEDELMAYVDVNKKAESTMLSGYGIAILRDGANYKSASASTVNNTHRDFWMWFGNTGAAHSHADALNIGIDAFGLDVAPDLGYPENTSYTPNRLQWVSTTLSHNTVVVDEKGQGSVKGIHGYPYHFDDSGKVKLMDADAKSVYPQTENYRRTVVMVQANDDVAYGVDFFRVTGGSHHLFSFHSQAENAYPISGIELTPDPVVQDKDGNDIVGSYQGPNVPFGNDPNTKNDWSYETFYPRGYTWLKNVRRDKEPETQFTVEFDVQDYRKILNDGKGIKLRMTQFNNFTPTEVAIAGGYMTVKSDTKMMPETWDYVLVERDGGEGANLDSLFTTVYEPYRNTPYIEEIKPIDIKVKSGNEVEGDMARAVKVKHTEANGGNTDYIVYATNKNVVYTVTDGDFSFDFSGFVGVYTLNANGAMIYRYVNDGTIIGEETGKVSAYTGTVTGFQTENAFENYIDVEIDCTDLNDLAGKYIYVDNDGVQNAAYQIVSATDSAEGLKTGSVRLDIGTVTLIRGHVDQKDLDKGYVYNIERGQTFSIPISFVDESVPEFDEVSDNLSVSAGSSITVNVHAKTPVIGDGAPTITYIGTTLPRGASINLESGVFAWKPDNSQIGDNHVAITARDSDGREATIHFDIAVYGSTTGGSSQNKTEESDKTETPSTDNTDSSAGGGGGGGGTAPTDKPDDETSTDESETSGESGDAENLPDASGKTDDVRFTDLSDHSWAEDAINTLATDGIIRGTSTNTFSPSSNITRADFALLLVRAFKLESDNTENFADVSASDYFASELAIARNTGIVNGIGDNKFAPRNTITRQDMMVIVYRALSSMGKIVASENIPEESDFETVADYAKEAVSALVAAELVNGKNGLIAPVDYTTRAEVAVLIKRILDYIK